MTNFCIVSWLEIIRNEGGVITTQEWHNRDLWDTYGAACESGTYNALFALPAMKERYTYDWGGSDGIEIWEEEDVKLAARNVTIPFVVIAGSEAECMSKYLALRSLLLGTKGYLQFYFPQWDRRFKLRYLSGDIEIMGTIRGNGQKAIRFNVTFSDDFPRIEPLIPASTFDPDAGPDLILD